jgi:NitT/TauT family transport system substrate-binding protein
MVTKKRQRNRIIAAISILAFLLAFLATKDRWLKYLPSTSERRLEPITIAQFGEVFLYAPLYIAKDGNYFSKRGLDVTLISTGGDEKTWAAVLSGNAIVGVADPTFIVISANRGLQGVAVASIIARAPFWGITFDKQIPFISEPKQLKGFSVATFPAPSTAYTLQKRMFQEGGLPPNIREGGFGTLISMIKAKQANIALELEPNVSQSLTTGARIVYGLDKIYGNFQTTGLTTLPSTINDEPGKLKSIVCSLADAMDFIRQHPEDAVTLLTKRFPEIERPVATQALKRMAESGVIPLTPVIQKDSWDNAIQLRKAVGDIKDGGQFEKFVDNQFTSNCSPPKGTK